MYINLLGLHLTPTANLHSKYSLDGEIDDCFMIFSCLIMYIFKLQNFMNFKNEIPEINYESFILSGNIYSLSFE